MPEEYFDFENFFNDKIKARGLSLEKVADATGITLRHLENLSRGRFEDLPPAPYFRGYLIKLGTLLDFDPNIWWERFQVMGVVKRSGPQDHLPKNRFAITSRTKYVASAVAAILILSFAGLRFSRILGKPILTVQNPRAELTTVREGKLKVYGYLKNGDNVSINNEGALVEGDGYFEKELGLEPGLNTISIQAKKFLGREANVIRQIFYESVNPEANIVF